MKQPNNAQPNLTQSRFRCITPPVSKRVQRSPELAQQICERIATGHSLRKICSKPGFPSFVFVFAWLNDDPNFVKQYSQARLIQADWYADEIIDKADAATPETANAVRGMVNARIWACSKLNPKKYGDNQAGVTINNNILVIAEDKRAQLMERRKALTQGQVQG